VQRVPRGFGFGHFPGGLSAGDPVLAAIIAACGRGDDSSGAEHCQLAHFSSSVHGTMHQCKPYSGSLRRSGHSCAAARSLTRGDDVSASSPPTRYLMIEELWYKNAVIYSLDLETFLDADGDGVGDFAGLIQRLEYLEYLGIDVVWLAPFQPTPNRDNGYDVMDYYGVDPRHGSSGDFVEFIHHAARRGIKVIMDLVVNHTSNEHPWFESARSDPESPHRDWYNWSKKRPANWNRGMVFPGEQDRVWTFDRKAGEYYYHRFYNFQPDLNMDNPEVRAEVRRIMGYWLQLGVDGFRLDAVPFMIESVVPGQEKGEHHFEYLAEYRRFLEWRSARTIVLGEANVAPEEMGHYFGENGDSGIHMMFNFYVNQHLFLSLASGEVAPLAEALEATRDIPPTSQWAQFLRNHDELDLGRLTEEQRKRVFERFAPERHMQLYDRGIRRRLAPMLGDREHEELAYSVMFSLPGAPVIRFGDELRMGDDLELDQRDAVRTPMQWADEPNAGFSTADRLVHPVIDDGVWSFRHVNVASQRRDPQSFLSWMVKMIHVRKECPEIGLGSYRILDGGSASVLVMRYDWRGNSVLMLHNFAATPQEVRLKLDGDGADRLSNLLEEEELRADDEGRHHIRLDALGYRWFRIGGLDYAVRRKRH
jgi:maltose alpha-D-glucosyltransferase / alpha-amylase